MTQLNHEEQLDIIQRYLAATDQGNWEDAVNIAQEMPLPAPVAFAFKQALGSDFVKKSGYDLSEAEVTYGKNWLG